MQANYDVVVIGAGPIGITTACSLKAIYNGLNICVIDKRAEPQRNHGLRINADSVDKIQNLLSEVLKSNSTQANHENIKELQTIFKNWGGSFVRTSQIELDLAKTASKMGVIVLRDKMYTISEINFPLLCANSNIIDENISFNVMKNLFANAKIIIGADGAHSIVRKVVMQNKLSHNEKLRHLVELKYQTHGQMQARGYKEASKDVMSHSVLSFETTSHDQSKLTKPVTLHLFVDEATYNGLRVKDDNDKLKGVFGNSWTIADLKELAKTDQNVSRVYAQIMNYLKDVTLRDGICENEQISTLSMDVYRSEHSVKKYHDKYVLLVGDAESGLVLERGFNKGLKGAAICAQAVANFFQEKNSDIEEEINELDNEKKIPQIFQDYEREMLEIFENERKWANIKNFSLKMVETSLYSSRMVSETSSSVIESSSKVMESSPSSCVLF